MEIKHMKQTEYYKNKRFSVFSKGYGEVQLRDNKTHPKGNGMRIGTVAVFNTMGGQFATFQTHQEGLRLAKKIARLLNK